MGAYLHRHYVIWTVHRALLIVRWPVRFSRFMMNIISGIALPLYREAFRTNTTALKCTCSYTCVMPAIRCQVYPLSSVSVVK